MPPFRVSPHTMYTKNSYLVNEFRQGEPQNPVLLRFWCKIFFKDHL
jgi:hypothetical protein